MTTVSAKSGSTGCGQCLVCGKIVVLRTRGETHPFCGECAKGVAPDLLAACKTALEHVRELREAWERGAIGERDNLGGTRSNRNVEVERALADAIAKAERGVA